jgi:hypothetical protein
MDASGPNQPNDLLRNSAGGGDDAAYAEYLTPDLSRTVYSRLFSRERLVAAAGVDRLCAADGDAERR